MLLSCTCKMEFAERQDCFLAGAAAECFPAPPSASQHLPAPPSASQSLPAPPALLEPLTSAGSAPGAPCLWVWCVRAPRSRGSGQLSRKFQETPQEAGGGSSQRPQLLPRASRCVCRDREREEKHKPVFKDIYLFTIKTVSQRQPDRAVFMRRSLTLEGFLPIASYTERERVACVISGQGEGKKRS